MQVLVCLHCTLIVWAPSQQRRHEDLPVQRKRKDTGFEESQRDQLCIFTWPSHADAQAFFSTEEACAGIQVPSWEQQ